MTVNHANFIIAPPCPSVMFDNLCSEQGLVEGAYLKKVYFGVHRLRLSIMSESNPLRLDKSTGHLEVFGNRLTYELLDKTEFFANKDDTILAFAPPGTLATDEIFSSSSQALTRLNYLISLKRISDADALEIFRVLGYNKQASSDLLLEARSTTRSSNDPLWP